MGLSHDAKLPTLWVFTGAHPVRMPAALPTLMSEIFLDFVVISVEVSFQIPATVTVNIIFPFYSSLRVTPRTEADVLINPRFRLIFSSKLN
jgi:hypothetical protein